MTVDSLIHALDSVVWYNGYGDIVSGWGDLRPKDGHGEYLTPPDNYGAQSKDEADQLQVIWMIAVMLFGNYGTSPRYGWIEDIDGFRQFILDITSTDREASKFIYD